MTLAAIADAVIGPNTRDAGQTLTNSVRLMPLLDFAVETGELDINLTQLICQWPECGSDKRRQALVSLISQNIQQNVHVAHIARCDEAQFGHPTLPATPLPPGAIPLTERIQIIRADAREALAVPADRRAHGTTNESFRHLISPA